MDKSGISKNKKILCISVMPDIGGGEELLQKLCGHPNEYDFVLASPEGKTMEYFRENGIRTVAINSLKKVYRGTGWNLLSFLKIVFNMKISTLRLLKLIRDEKPALILANGLFAALYVLPSAVFTQKKFLVVQHLIFNKKSVENRVLKQIFRRTEKMVCVSGAVKNNVISMLNKTGSDKIVVIPNGIHLPENREEGPVDKSKIRIGMVGSIIRIKGIHLVIEALKSILTQSELCLYVYGTTSKDQDSVRYRNELTGLINEYSITEKIFFPGFTESRDDIYSSLDILINFSVIPEALPFAVLEAMAYKKIVVAAEAGGSGEIIKDGENGFLVKQGDLDQLREKIEFCIKNINSESFKRVRTNAYERVKNHYSMEKFIENYSNIFHSLIE